jgi:hypothetical protein
MVSAMMGYELAAVFFSSGADPRMVPELTNGSNRGVKVDLKSGRAMIKESYFSLLFFSSKWK